MPEDLRTLYSSQFACLTLCLSTYRSFAMCPELRFSAECAPVPTLCLRTTSLAGLILARHRGLSYQEQETSCSQCVPHPPRTRCRVCPCSSTSQRGTWAVSNTSVSIRYRKVLLVAVACNHCECSVSRYRSSSCCHSFC